MKILIAEEKHGQRYFDASTNEKLHEACKKLISERLESTRFNFYENPEEVKEMIEQDMTLLGKRKMPHLFLFLSSRNGEYENVYLEELE